MIHFEPMHDPGTMAVVGAVVGLVGGIAQGVGQVAQGEMANEAFRQEARATEHEGAVAREELEEEAKATERENKKFAAAQRLAFLKNGVTMEGSPLLVQKETIDTGKREAFALRKRGFRVEQKASQQAAALRARGRAALIGGRFGAFGTAAQSFGPKGSAMQLSTALS